MDRVDETSGFCPQTGVFHSKRSPLQLPISSSSSISGFLLQQSSRSPDHSLAYIDASHGYAALSYGELGFLARKASAGLWALGARPGDVLLLLAPNSARSSIMFLAAASIGVVFAASNPSSLSSEIAKQASISGAKFIATTEEILPKTEPLELPTIILFARKEEEEEQEEEEEEANMLLSSSPSSTRGSLPNCRTSLSSRHVSFSDLVSDGVGFPPEVPVRTDDTASLMFSSGTAGLSKCVALSHRNLISHAIFFRSRETGIPWSSRVYMCILPMFHVYGLCTFCSAILATGCPTVILPKFEMQEMLSAIEKYKVTHLPLVPPVMRALARSSLVNMYDLSSLHHVSVGAAPVSKELITEFRLRFPNVHVMPQERTSTRGPISYEFNKRLVHYLDTKITHADTNDLNDITKHKSTHVHDVGIVTKAASFWNVRIVVIMEGYGLTETTAVGANAAGVEHLQIDGSVGLLAPNTMAKIVDIDSKKALPPGQHGEIWLRGPSIMQGYLNQPKETKETIDEEGWLHTGDLGYFDENGFLFITDRVKELIKYKGYQVAPAELEAILMSHPQIEDAAVVAFPDEEAGEIPVAYIVEAQGSIVTEKEVIDFVAQRVAPFKKIRGVVKVKSIPKSAAGKILRRQLVSSRSMATSKL